jgi:hypothetical protein
MSIFANAEHRISAYRTYFQIAKINQNLFHRCKQTRVAREANVSEDELTEAFETIERLTEQQWQAAMIAVTFAGMTLEAFFYDYAADALGDQYVRDHLDKLDLPSKYLVYPKLVCDAAPKNGPIANARMREDRCDGRRRRGAADAVSGGFVRVGVVEADLRTREGLWNIRCRTW